MNVEDLRKIDRSLKETTTNSAVTESQLYQTLTKSRRNPRASTCSREDQAKKKAKKKQQNSQEP
jgi:hypothetical protein